MSGINESSTPEAKEAAGSVDKPVSERGAESQPAQSAASQSVPTGLREREYADGLSLPELSFGCFGFGTGAYGKLDDEVREALIHRAFERGIRSFDVAPVWGDSEDALKRFLGAERLSESKIITRAGRRFVDGDLSMSFDEASIRADLERSLERFGLSSIEVLLLHAPPPQELVKRGHALHAARKLRDEGLVKAIGVSAPTLAHAHAAIDMGAEILALPVNLLNSDELAAIRDELQEKSIGLLATSPLLHGLLADQTSLAHRFPERDHRSLRWSPSALRARLKHVAALRYLNDESIRYMSVVALRYVLAQAEVTSVCIGPRSVAQFDQLFDGRGEAPYLPPVKLARLPQILATVGA